MNKEDEQKYTLIRSGTTGFCEQKRGLIAVWGKESVQFLNGLITNDVAKLENDAQMFAAFPNAQGRLIALVRIRRQADKFLFDTEEATHDKVFTNLFRFTYAGDFFVEDLSEQFRYFELFGSQPDRQDEIHFGGRLGTGWFVPADSVSGFRDQLAVANAVNVTDEIYEVLRIESGNPKYGVDMDETTIVPELGIDGVISYNKGCYIGQEIIARIHFRGHVAKQLTGLVLSDGHDAADGAIVGSQNAQLKSPDGKNAGRITSVTFSPALNRTIMLGYVRYDYLADGTQLQCGGDVAIVRQLPFIQV